MDSGREKLLGQGSDDSGSSTPPPGHVEVRTVVIVNPTDTSSSGTSEQTTESSSDNGVDTRVLLSGSPSREQDSLAVPLDGTPMQVNVARPPEPSNVEGSSQQPIPIEQPGQVTPPTEDSRSGPELPSDDSSGHKPEPAQVTQDSTSTPSDGASGELNVAPPPGLSSQQPTTTDEQVQATSPTGDSPPDVPEVPSSGSSDDVAEAAPLIHDSATKAGRLVPSGDMEPSDASSSSQQRSLLPDVSPSENNTSDAAESLSDENRVVSTVPQPSTTGHRPVTRQQTMPGPCRITPEDISSARPIIFDPDQPSTSRDVRQVTPSDTTESSSQPSSRGSAESSSEASDVLYARQPEKKKDDESSGVAAAGPEDPSGVTGAVPASPPVTLYLSGQCRNLPSFQPDCLKICTWMRAMNAHWEIVNQKLDLDGRYPRVKIGDSEPIKNSYAIFDEIKAKLPALRNLDGRLSPEQQRLAKSLASEVEDYLGGEHREWYRSKRGELRRAYDIDLKQCWATWWPVRVIPNFVLKFMFNRTSSPRQPLDSILRASHSEVILDELTTLLGNKTFFFGNEVSTLDVRVFAVLKPILEIRNEVTFELRDVIRNNYNSLVRFTENVKEGIYPGSAWATLCSPGGDNRTAQGHHQFRHLPGIEVERPRSENYEELAV